MSDDKRDNSSGSDEETFVRALEGLAEKEGPEDKIVEVADALGMSEDYPSDASQENE